MNTHNMFLYEEIRNPLIITKHLPQRLKTHCLKRMVCKKYSVEAISLLRCETTV